MILDLIVELAWKSVLCAGAILVMLFFLRRRSAAEKSLVAHVGVLALLLLPAATIALPALLVSLPEPAASYVEEARPAAQPILPNADIAPPGWIGAAPDAPAAPAVPPALDWNALLGAAYLTVCAAFLAGLLLAMLRLQRVRRRAELIEDTDWLAALVAAQRRAGFKHGTALLASAELKSPVSWGLLRPIIIVDEAALADKSRAEAIIAHELAHVTRKDWPGLLLGRIALAIYWFNPLVWLLVRQAHHFSEEAADDVVLGTKVASCDYAELLLGSGRHAHRPLALAANGVAPSRSSLGKRIDHVLDTKRARHPARPGWLLGSLGLTFLLGGVLAAAEPVSSVAARAELVASGQAASRARQVLAEKRIPAPASAAVPEAQRETLASLVREEGEPVPSPAPAPAVTPAQGASAFPSDDYARQLVALLRSADPAVRAEAASALGDLANPNARAALEAARRDPDPRVRGEAANALEEIHYVEDILRRFPGRLGDAFPSDGHMRQLASLLGDPLPSVRFRAAQGLGDLQNPNARPMLEAARNDEDRGVRARVSWALARVAETEDILRRFGAN